MHKGTIFKTSQKPQEGSPTVFSIPPKPNLDKAKTTQPYPCGLLTQLVLGSLRL